MKIAQNVVELIGHTPLVRLNRVVEKGMAEVDLKLERNNPGGSVKDRPAYNMIRAAMDEGKLPPGAVIVEPTSGNTGIGLAMVAAALGIRCIITMPEGATAERVHIMQAYGAEVRLSPKDEGMPGAIRLAGELVDTLPGAFMPQQFENPANPAAHEATTAVEILEDTDGQLDAFVATAGTGGTVTGAGRALKKALPKLIVVTVEPKSSPVLSGKPPGRNRIPGLGPGFIPKILDRSVYDRLLTIDDDEALAMTLRLCREEGLFLGPSSGASTLAALAIARELGPGRRVVAIAPDTGERYLSSAPFA